MKKRIIIFFSIAIILLALPVGFAFASEECDHVYTDDNDCTTQVVCSKCNEVVIEALEHDFKATLSYTFNEDESGEESYLLGGYKTARCKHKGCQKTDNITLQPFIFHLGYSIKEDSFIVTNKDGTKDTKTTATVISTFLFNVTEIEEYASFRAKKFEYGTFVYKKDSLILARICSGCNYLYDGTILVSETQDDETEELKYVKTQWKDVPSTYKCPKCNASKDAFYEEAEPPISPDTGRFHKNVYLPNGGEAGRINDISIMNIGEADYNAELVIAAYFALDGKAFYVQSNKIITDYKDLVPVTCDKILEKLEENK